MGQEGYFKCKDCGHRFKGRMGGSTIAREYRCVNCDRIKTIVTGERGTPGYKEPTKEQIGTCAKCGGELRDDINPMCFKCRSRNVELEEVTMFYD